MAFDPLLHVFYRAEVGAKPISVILEITHACNVDCEHCYLDLVPDKKIGALGTEEWKDVLRQLKAAGCLFLTLTGGEVLVRRDFFEIAGYARELGMALTIFTNGTLIDEANADRIAALRPMGVEISLLGGIPATHDAVARRRGAFDKTIAGVRRLRARGTPVLLKTVLMRKNVSEQAAMQSIADSLGCNLLVDVEVSPKDDGSLGPKAFVADDDALIAAVRAVVDDQAAKYGPPEETSREERLDAVPCAAGRRTCQIGPTGDVFPCTQWKEPIGNVRATSFLELWDHSEAFERIRATRIKDIPICSECDLIDTCTPCMALGLLEVGAIGPSPTKCAAAELRAKADGHPGRSAWFLKLERDALASGGALGPDRPRVRLPLVG